MSFVANIVKDRPNDGARVKGDQIRPAANEVNNPANPTGGLDTEGTAGKDVVRGTNKSDVIRGNDGNDNLNGRARQDLLSGEGGNDVLRGGGGNDTLVGGDGNDVLKGGDGKDLITGDRGNDKIMGGRGDDLIVGGEGNDILRGGRGDDILEGGLGADTYVFKGNDFGGGFSAKTVIGFNKGEDILELISGASRSFSGMTVGSDFVVGVTNKNNALISTITFVGLGGQINDASGLSASAMSNMFVQADIT